jgi:tetratricopeptide (TPR) repeat protein
MLYLSYSYLQSGDDGSARRVVESIKDLPGARSNDVVNNSAILEALYAVETHDWQQAATLPSQPSAFPFARLRTYWARAIGAARSGDIIAARQNIEKLDQARTSMVGYMQSVGCQMHTAHSIDPVSVQQLEAQAWLAWAEGKPVEALALMRNAATKEEAYGVESRTVPAYEMLGDLLLEMRQPESALVAYEAALKEAPVRLNALAGAARASRAMGNLEGARTYYAAFVKCCSPKAARKELAEAKLFLAGS